MPKATKVADMSGKLSGDPCSVIAELVAQMTSTSRSTEWENNTRKAFTTILNDASQVDALMPGITSAAVSYESDARDILANTSELSFISVTVLSRFFALALNCGYTRDSIRTTIYTYAKTIQKPTVSISNTQLIVAVVSIAILIVYLRQ
jgi:hypothetical protein